ncbi:MAG: hypothetical protein WC408_06335 [Candidatus Micrarchaeia archaeon]|jgi:hypothetical protein
MANLFPKLDPNRIKGEPFYSTLSSLRKKAPGNAPAKILQKGIGELGSYVSRLAEEGRKTGGTGTCSGKPTSW